MCDSFDMVRTINTYPEDALYISPAHYLYFFFPPGTPRAFNLTEWDLMMSAFFINLQRYTIWSSHGVLPPCVELIYALVVLVWCAMFCPELNKAPCSSICSPAVNRPRPLRTSARAFLKELYGTPARTIKACGETSHLRRTDLHGCVSMHLNVSNVIFTKEKNVWTPLVKHKTYDRPTLKHTNTGKCLAAHVQKTGRHRKH